MTQGRRINSFGREYQDLPTRRLDDTITAKGKSRYRNRRRFCGGHEGREHVWTFDKAYGGLFSIRPFHTERCATCGKKRYAEGRFNGECRCGRSTTASA